MYHAFLDKILPTAKPALTLNVAYKI